MCVQGGRWEQSECCVCRVGGSKVNVVCVGGGSKVNVVRAEREGGGGVNVVCVGWEKYPNSPTPNDIFLVKIRAEQ